MNKQIVELNSWYIDMSNLIGSNMSCVICMFSSQDKETANFLVCVKLK